MSYENVHTILVSHHDKNTAVEIFDKTINRYLEDGWKLRGKMHHLSYGGYTLSQQLIKTFTKDSE